MKNYLLQNDYLEQQAKYKQFFGITERKVK